MSLMRYTLGAGVLIGTLVLTTPARAAEACKLEITGNDLMQYDKTELAAPASCKEITVTLHHAGKLPKEAMGHNWVLVNAADLTPVANDGMTAGLPNNFVKPGDKRVLAHTQTIGGGETTSVTFPASALKKGGAYVYLCTFPGHNALMHGTFKFG